MPWCLAHVLVPNGVTESGGPGLRTKVPLVLGIVNLRIVFLHEYDFGLNRTLSFMIHYK